MTEAELKNIRGLSTEEVLDRQSKEGLNELPTAKKRGILHIVLGVFKEPMFLLLVACGVLYLILGEPQEALLLLGFVFVIMGITIYQENKTENALEALQDLSSPRALVIRNGEQTRIAGKEVVREDVMILREGDRVPADAVLLWDMNLTVDESLLTGESVPVRKVAVDHPEAVECKPGGDDTPYLFSGSMVVQGQGVAKVRSIGASTELGKIGKALQVIENESAPLQKETGTLVKNIFLIAVGLCLIVVLIYGFTRNDWLSGILSGLTLAMAMLPEEFPVVLTIFLALGAWRISKKQVLTRRVAAIETLGAATVLCSDKTGTLTQNKMTIKKIYMHRAKDKGVFYDIWENRARELPEEFHELIEYGILASKKDPFDPMDKAFKELGVKKLSNTEHIHEDWPLVEEYPLSRELLALSHAWENRENNCYTVAAKGAPEAIMDLCHFTGEEIAMMEKKIEEMAREGLRILGVAKCVFDRKKLPDNQHDFNFEYMGLVGLADPIRETVPESIRECDQAGIRVVMITGDYPLTAVNIAKQIGLTNPESVISGPELDKMTPDELRLRIRATNVFARIVPEQKMLIVNAFKDNGEIVAMTGDGVNDAPALKASHIGIAMGERGTDVAREASDLVLLKDDFTSIRDAVKLGRRIFDNLKKAMAYIVSVHVPIAGLTLLPAVLGLPVMLFPVHIVFLELIIDPACSVVFENEAEEENSMKRPPRPRSEPLFGPRMLLLSLLQGAMVMIAVFAVMFVSGMMTDFGIVVKSLANNAFDIALRIVRSETEVRAMTFVALIVSNVGLIMTNRSWSNGMIASLKKPNSALGWVVFGALAFLGLVIYTPFLNGLFHFSPLGWSDLGISLLVGVLGVIWFELVKIFARRKGVELLKN